MRAAALAARFSGVLTAQQLATVGIGADGVRRRLAAGRLHLLHRGVYAWGHPAIDVRGKRLAAVGGAGPGAVLSHRTAADAWGLRTYNGARIDVLVPNGTRRTLARVRIHQTRTLHPEDVDELDGIPITSVARTIVDCAATATEHDIERMVHEAEVRRILDTRAIERALSRRPNARNAALVRAAISTSSPGPTRRDLEHRFLALVRCYGLDTPRLNTGVETRLGVLEVDALWSERKLVVELDGAATHHTRRAFERDRIRDAALAEQGHLVIRITWRRMTDEPAEVARQLRVLSRAARSGAP
jgi:very-short-patch-repair endonuclease